MKKLGNILWGIVLIALGLILGLNALGITNINLFFDGWWTMFIIIPCFIGLIKDRDKTGNLIGLLIGFVLLLCAQDVLSYEMIWKLMIPTILVIIGLSLVFKDAIGTKINKRIKEINKDKNTNSEFCATFAEQNINFNDQEFKGTDISAIFGGAKCDLTKSIITEDVVINATAIFGGIDILVPNNVNVKVKSTPIFGGVDDKTTKQAVPDSPTIYINATCTFGGVTIK